jgi:hypothetical protein
MDAIGMKLMLSSRSRWMIYRRTASMYYGLRFFSMDGFHNWRFRWKDGWSFCLGYKYPALLFLCVCARVCCCWRRTACFVSVFTDASLGRMQKLLRVLRAHIWSFVCKQ